MQQGRFQCAEVRGWILLARVVCRQAEEELPRLNLLNGERGSLFVPLMASVCNPRQGTIILDRYRAVGEPYKLNQHGCRLVHVGWIAMVADADAFSAVQPASWKPA